MISLEAQQPEFLPSVYSKPTSLFAAVGIATFVFYERSLCSYHQKLLDNVTQRKIGEDRYHIPQFILGTTWPY